ncbi:head maturation protease, ClpP-related [Prauserella flavalba]|uniref:head maturation protease, ClpP-related n=1 Tax=Prauserella flavalba TaxID=1477506 RepID=UPI0036E5B41D
MPQATAGRSWYSISNATDGAAVVRIYDEISWWGVSADQFIHDLDGITTDRIRVEINSPGGDVFDAVAIYNALRVHPAHVTTRVDGLAASAASLIVQAGDHRVMLSSAQMMIHNAWGIAIGNADEHREMATLLDQQDDVIAGIYANRSGGDRQEFRTLMAAETWLTDAETVERGLADEVIDPPRRDAPENRGETLHDQISRAMDVVSGAVNSAERVGALRAEKGKSLSQVNRDSVGALVDHLERLKALLDADEPQPDPSAAQREFLRNVARRVTVSS